MKKLRIGSLCKDCSSWVGRSKVGQEELGTCSLTDMQTSASHTCWFCRPPTLAEPYAQGRPVRVRVEPMEDGKSD